MDEINIEHMSIEYILRNTRFSCDFYSPFSERYFGDTEDEQLTSFWMHAIQYKADDSGFMDLVDSILENGWHPTSTVGIYMGEDGAVEITEGHHRLVAAILLGMDTVPTTKWGTRCTIDGEEIVAHMNPHKPDHSLMFNLF